MARRPSGLRRPDPIPASILGWSEHVRFRTMVPTYVRYSSSVETVPPDEPDTID